MTVTNTPASSRNSASNFEWDTVYDLVAVGSGAAGLSAALYGAQAGMKVLVCEQADKLGEPRLCLTE